MGNVVKNITSLQPPLQIINLQSSLIVAGIAPIYGNMVCVAHGDESLCVYTGDGDLRRKVSIPEIEEGICGVVAVDGKQGKLAVVGDTRQVHFVTLSADLEVQQHTTKDVPLEADRISLSGQRQLIVSGWNEKAFVVLPADGDGPLTTVRTDLPGGWGRWYIVQIQAGYVVCKYYAESF